MFLFSCRQNEATDVRRNTHTHSLSHFLYSQTTNIITLLKTHLFTCELKKHICHNPGQHKHEMQIEDKRKFKRKILESSTACNVQN